LDLKRVILFLLIKSLYICSKIPFAITSLLYSTSAVCTYANTSSGRNNIKLDKFLYVYKETLYFLLLFYFTDKNLKSNSTKCNFIYVYFKSYFLA